MTTGWLDSATEVNQRLDRVRSWMAERGLDALLLRRRRHFAWLTGGRSNHIVLAEPEGVADLLLLPDRFLCVTTTMESARIAEEELDGLEIEMVEADWTVGTGDLLASLCLNRRVASDVPVHLPTARSCQVIPDELARLSWVLEPSERKRYRALGQAAARVVEGVCREIKPGMTEREVAAEVARRAWVNGIQTPVVLVAADARIYRYRHPIPTDQPIEKQVLVVLCGERWGLIANLTRMVHFGSLPDSLSELRPALASVDAAMIAATRPGATLSHVFAQAVKGYQEAGYPDSWRWLHQGGPTGYATREVLATPHNRETVQLYQAFAWNPSLPGLKSEDTILVGDSENEVLTHTGEWVYLTVPLAEGTIHRPDVLVLDP